MALLCWAWVRCGLAEGSTLGDRFWEFIASPYFQFLSLHHAWGGRCDLLALCSSCCPSYCHVSPTIWTLSTTVSLTMRTLPLQLCLPHHDDSPSIIVNQNKLYQSLLVMVITATNTRGCFTSKLQHPAWWLCTIAILTSSLQTSNVPLRLETNVIFLMKAPTYWLNGTLNS